MNKHQKNTSFLAEERIDKLLFRLSAPSIFGMIVIALFNIIDSIFVGQGVGVNALAGISIVFPIQMFVNALSLAIGIGGASIISRRLGEKNLKSASETFSNVIFLAVLIGALISVAVYWNITPILHLFGAAPEIISYAHDYLSIIMLGVFFFAFALSSNNIIRAEGNAKTSMIAMLISGVSNLILDPIFIFGFHMGVRGAAIATVISQILTASFILYYFLSGKSILKLSFKSLKIRISIIKEILFIGFGGFARQASSSVMMVILNNTLALYGGNVGIAAFGIIFKLLMFALMPLFGIAQGFQPMVGFNYGAQNMDRVKASLMLAMKISTVISVFAFTIFFTFPKFLFLLFNNDPELIRIGSTALRIIVLALPLIGFQVIGSTFFQALGKAGEFLVLSISRQIIFLIPLVLILPRFFHITGIWISFPIADLLASIVTGFFLIRELKRIHLLPGID